MPAARDYDDIRPHIETIATDPEVAPSTLIRFANYFGFKGFSELQQIYHTALKDRMDGYRARIQDNKTTDSPTIHQPKTGYELLNHFSAIKTDMTRHFATHISQEKFEQALNFMEQADTIYINGMRRAYPVAFYIAYALMRADFNIVLLDNPGGLNHNQIKRISSQDLLLAVTYHPHAIETTEYIRTAHKTSAKVISITDHSIHPCSRLIDLSLNVKETQFKGVRSLSGSMHLAHSLIIGLLCK